MENPMGFAHFISNADGVARFILTVMLLASIGTWYLIVAKGVRIFGLLRRSAAFLDDFWAAPSLEAVATRLRERGAVDPFSHLLHHGFTAIEQHNRDDPLTGSGLCPACRRGALRLFQSGDRNIALARNRCQP